MKIELFNIGKFSIHGYGFMIGIGFLIALLIGCYRAKKYGLKDEAVIDIAILSGVFGFAGAKVLFVIVEFRSFIKNPMDVLGSSGFVVYGGIISGVLASYIYCRIKKLVFLEYFDIIIPEVAVAQGFGRIGCFLAGCCYGRQTDSAFGVVFPSGCMAPAGVKLIPTQLISSAGNFVIAVLLMITAYKFLYNKKEQNSDKKIHGLISGDIGNMYLVLYGIGRFVIEFFRNDDRGAVGILSTSQFISFFIVALGVTLYFYNRKVYKLKNKI